jgi:hypothetical protein
MKRLLLTALLTIGCTCEDSSAQALRGHGFTDIQWTGYSFFACSDSDTFSTGFRAKNPKGETVEGTVCCGWLKNCTVRF